MRLVHLTAAAAWASSVEGSLHGDPSLDREGFLHLSTVDAVLIPANEFLRGRTDLVALVVDADRLDPTLLRFEAGSPPHGDRTFPHLYGPLPVAAVVEVVPFPPGADGSFELPDGLRRHLG